MPINFESRPENVERINKIVAYLSVRKDGDTVTWVELEQATGISMRSPPYKGVDGRGLTRRALAKMKREVETIIGTGFRLSSPENTSIIMADRLLRTQKSIRRSSKVGSHLYERHGQQLTSDARDRLTRANALLATLGMQATDGRKQLK